MLAEFKHITSFIFDLDGVLTDGSLYVFDDGQQVRKMNIKDGYALQLAVKKGYNVGVISGSNSEAAQIRLSRLGIIDISMKVLDKTAKFREYISKWNVAAKSVVYMGDDIPDLEVMKLAGISSAPLDAVAEVKHVARYISPYAGGQGCVRDVIEKVLKLNGHWDLKTDVPSR